MTDLNNISFQILKAVKDYEDNICGIYECALSCGLNVEQFTVLLIEMGVLREFYEEANE